MEKGVVALETVGREICGCLSYAMRPGSSGKMATAFSRDAPGVQKGSRISSLCVCARAPFVL